MKQPTIFFALALATTLLLGCGKSETDLSTNSTANVMPNQAGTTFSNPSRQQDQVLAAAVHEDCTLTVSGPFIYVDMVFPVIEVRCDSVKQTIHIEAALDMDGSQVAQSSRTCRKTNKCVTGLASDGIFVHDVPGDQLYCGRGSAKVRTKEGSRSFPEQTSCESDSF
jgi:hypothetical protein